MTSSIGVFVLLAVAVTASALVVEDQEFSAENLDLEEKEFGTQWSDNPEALQNAQSTRITKRSRCGRHCIGIGFMGICVGWEIRCRRNEIPDQPIQLPSNGVEIAALNNLESQPIEKLPTTRRVEVCLLCASVWVFKICPICLRWGKQKSADVADLSTFNDVVLVSAEEQKAAFAVLDGESQASFRNFYNEKVVKAEKYEFPSSLLGKGVTEEKSVDGVVVTLADGRRFFVIQGGELWKGKSTAILKPGVMANIWTVVESKDVQSSTVADYVRASDSSASSREAAENMMALN